MPATTHPAKPISTRVPPRGKSRSAKTAAGKRAPRPASSAPKRATKSSRPKLGGKTLGAALPGKLIVIPPSNYQPLSAPLAAPAGIGGLVGNLAAPLSSIVTAAHRGLSALLGERRSRLLSFASEILSSAAGLKVLGLGAATAAASAIAGAASSAARSAAPAAEPVLCLEAVGALIVDESAVDRVALQASSGATIIENILVPLIQASKKPKKKKKTAKNPKPGSADAVPWHLSSIKIAAARAKKLTGKNQIIGILDTGIAADHPEFKGKKVHFAEFDANGNKLARKARDAGDHGTHVCGLAAGKTVGVAPDAELAVAAVLTIPGSRGLSGYFAQILAGLNWLLTENFADNPDSPGVDVLNASLGGEGYDDYAYHPLAVARQMTGTLMAAAIGNSGPSANRHGSPGNYDIVVGVGAVNRDDDVASFSDHGKVAEHGGLRKPDLCAPGEGVVSAAPDGTYQSMDGTSMASPIVAGILALLLEQDPELSVDAPRLSKRLFALTRPLKGAQNRARGGGGTVDLTAIGS